MFIATTDLSQMAFVKFKRASRNLGISLLCQRKSSKRREAYRCLRLQACSVRYLARFHLSTFWNCL